MGKEILTFGDIEIEKKGFYRSKIPVHLRDPDIEKVLASNNISFGKKNYKYFIGYLYNNHKVKQVHIMLPKMDDGQIKWMYFLIIDDELLRKYNTIWDKVWADIKKEFDTEPVYNKEFLKTKIKSHGDKVTDSHDKEIPKVDFDHTCLAVISLDSAIKRDDDYYPQVLLKVCKYIEKKVVRHIYDNLSYSSSDESDESD